MSYKIIHTADWHLGQSFMQKSRIQEHQLFINWLLNIIKTENIDAIIIAGDIFDTANPPIEAMNIYHQFLAQAYQSCVEIIIVGGNHDSAARLNTTGSLLQFLNVHVVGGEAHTLGSIIQLKSKTNKSTVCLVAAIPYIRYGDVRKILEGENVKEAASFFTDSVKLHYDKFLNEAQRLSLNVPILSTAHLYVNGSSISDPSDEKMHTIGSLGQVSSKCFSQGYSYIALGHIHKPQTIKNGQNIVIKYAGSPIPLSFSEREDQKEVTIIEIKDNLLTSKSVEIECFRNLIRFKGTAEELLLNIKNHENIKNLKSWVEVILTERINFNAFNKEIDILAQANNIEILSKGLELPKVESSSLRNNFIAGIDTNPLNNVKDIFIRKCEKTGLNEENINELMPLFDQTIEDISNPTA